MILAVALLLAPTAMAQDYFAKLRYYFGENSPIVKQENTLTIHNTYYTSLNGKRRVNSQSINSNYQSQKPITSTA